MEMKLDGNLNPKFRMIFLGTRKVGKTSIINQMINSSFREDYYPTKDLIIYKKLYNFNPKRGDFDDFIYAEMIDTMAYDRSKNLKDFSDFFTIHLTKERDISKFNLNCKIPENIIKSIKHDYSSKGTAKGLFSNDKIMAYILVFDYNDEESLEEMLELFYSISSDESLKVTDENKKTVKVFVCNKYPFLISDVPPDVDYREEIKAYMQRDTYTQEIIHKIQRRIPKESDALQMTFFTSTKFNLGINNLFNSIFSKIKHREDLWQKIAYENKESNKDKDSVKDESEDLPSGFFCCRRKGGEKVDQTKNESYNDMRKFKDEEEDNDHDQNVKVPPDESHLQAELIKKEEDKSNCILI